MRHFTLLLCLLAFLVAVAAQGQQITPGPIDRTARALATNAAAVASNALSLAQLALTNDQPLFAYSTTNGQTSVQFAWPAGITNIEIVASVSGAGDNPSPTDTFVLTPLPSSISGTNGFRIRELWSSSTSPTVTFSPTLAMLGLGNCTGTNGFANGYRHQTTGQYRRNDVGFAFRYEGYAFGANATNYFFERRSGIWAAGAATTNLTFTLLSGQPFATNSTITIFGR
jgi:hypothetical protein